ncbi:hypothetical protein P20311_3548 [Pseudoalteromonas sp. BSi20311]|nr:hypothetical protein P20311_3548 [Pseudoalteromonas sp. BSi20311]
MYLFATNLNGHIKLNNFFLGKNYNNYEKIFQKISFYSFKGEI